MIVQRSARDGFTPGDYHSSRTRSTRASRQPGPSIACRAPPVPDGGARRRPRGVGRGDPRRSRTAKRITTSLKNIALRTMNRQAPVARHAWRGIGFHARIFEADLRVTGRKAVIPRIQTKNNEPERGWIEALGRC